MKTWDDLTFWNTGEWQVMEERLNDWDDRGIKYNPDRELIFAALDEVPLEEVEVMFIGQDPYPDPEFACGVAFSVGQYKKGPYPQTLKMIFEEYEHDLHYPCPTSGDLSPWCSQGVLLWNSIPTCFEGKSLSHNFPEWGQLTKELVEVVSARGCVLVFFGALAREYVKYANPASRTIETAHPSPRGNRFSKKPFLGSRIFTRCNEALRDLNRPPINWRLP